MYDLYSIITKAVQLLPNGCEYKNIYPFDIYIKEFRTIEIMVPRRVGKTTALLKFHNSVSSLLLSFSHYNRLTEDTYTDIEQIMRRIRGMMPNTGLKYRCILVDEYTNIDITRLIYELSIAKLIEEDFFILKVGTPR